MDPPYNHEKLPQTAKHENSEKGLLKRTVRTASPKKAYMLRACAQSGFLPMNTVSCFGLIPLSAHR